MDSTKDRRDLLIQILRERVQYHKNKFISPFIHEEMSHMETKRNGKVEHSATSHDDQVFSYLMALYVWYEGTDLKERYNINKCSIRTEDNIDEAINGLDEGISSIFTEIENINGGVDENDDINKSIKELKSGQGMLLKDYIRRERKKEDEIMKLMLQNRAIKKSYAISHGMTEEDVDNMFNMDGKAIPDSVLMDFYKDDEDILNGQVSNILKRYEQDMKMNNLR